MLLEISSICDLNCKTCPRKKRKGKQGHMSLEIFKEITDKTIKSRFENSLYLSGFGESMLNPHFFDMIKYAKSKGCRLIMPTNSNSINETNIKWLRLIDLLQLSIDSLKDENRRTINPQKILDLIPILQKYRINFMFNVALGKENWNELSNFLLLNIEKQIPINFIAIKPIFTDDDFLFDEMNFLATYAKELKEKIRPFPQVYFDESCRSFELGRMRNNDFAIAWDGKLFPCSYAFFKDYSFGNVKDYSSFDGFWQSEEMQRVKNGAHPICDFCKRCDKIRLNAEIENSNKDISIQNFKNKHYGKRCFVLGTGRSLTKEIINKVRNEITIGVNSLVFAKDLWNFEPTYFCFSDYEMIKIKSRYEALKKFEKSKIFYSDFLYYFVTGIMKMHLTEEEKISLSKYIHIRWKNAHQGWEFHILSSDDISFDLIKDGTSMCGTIIQDLAIPIAAWMGCKEIYLLGCDCDTKGYCFKNDKTGKNDLNQYGTGQYRYFKDKLNEIGIKLYNLSPSKIPYIENKDLDAILEE